MHRTLAVFQASITRLAGRPSTLGLPSGAALRFDEVLVWPWRLDEDTALKHCSGTAGQLPPPPNLHCIVLAPDTAVLERIRVGLSREPVIGSEQLTVRVEFENLSSETALRLFAAAGMVPQLCLSYLLRAA